MYLLSVPVYQAVNGLPDLICQVLDDWAVRMVLEILSVLCSVPAFIVLPELILFDQAVPLFEQLLPFPLILCPGQRFLEIPVSTGLCHLPVSRQCFLKQCIINLPMDLKPFFQNIFLPGFCLQRQSQHKILFLDILHSLFTSIAVYKNSGSSPCRPESSGCT